MSTLRKRIYTSMISGPSCQMHGKITVLKELFGDNKMLLSSPTDGDSKILSISPIGVMVKTWKIRPA
jgi:hypothetical protein